MHDSRPEQVDLPGPDWQWRLRLHAWREQIRANPATRQMYRWVVGGVGFVVVVIGLIMVPFPGPGWLVVFIGVAIWASEFHWARRLLAFGRRMLTRWNAWMLAQGWPARIAVTLGCFVLICGFFWVLLKVVGVPVWVPEVARNVLHTYAGL